MPDQENDYQADVVELFFDLAFVFAFSRLVAELAHHHDWPAAGRTLLTFLMIWFASTQFTWAANTVPGNQRVVRVMFLVATITSLPMAASVNSALSGGGAVFALSLALIVALGQGLLLLNVDHDADGFRSIMQLSIMTTIAVGLSVVGGFVDEGPRVALWTLAIVTFLTVMTSHAGRSGWIIRPGHMSERHGLIIIVALGEMVMAVGAPVVQGLTEGAGLPTPTLLSLVGAGGFVVLLWWSIFDRLHPSMEIFMENLREQKRVSFARDVYTLIYMPIRELTHYAKLSDLLEGATELGVVLPVLDNPVATQLPEHLQSVGLLADGFYTLLYFTMQELFSGIDQPSTIGVLYGLMSKCLRTTAVYLSRQPVDRARTSGASFRRFDFGHEPWAEVAALADSVAVNHPELSEVADAAARLATVAESKA